MIQEADALLKRLCRMLSLDALIRSKEHLGREQDMAALRQLRAIRERLAGGGSLNPDLLT
jgi:hypothetical protein